MKAGLQQAPIRNASLIAASVYSHSGEYAPVARDMRLPGRGFDLDFSRFYRSSLAERIGELGRGWSCSLTKSVESDADDVLYRNGAGEVYRFAQGRKGEYHTPTGFYGVMKREKKELVIEHRFGLRSRFRLPEEGGQILSVEDRNHNLHRFSYADDAVHVVDSLSRRISLSMKGGLLRDLTDHVGRRWNFLYDDDQRLVQVVQASTAAFPDGTSLSYGYDGEHRLTSLTDAKGQTYLVSNYDAAGRVTEQRHGSGTYRIEYEEAATGKDGFPVYRTRCHQKNGSILELEHNEAGNVTLSTLQVQRESFAPDDIAAIGGETVRLATASSYNPNGEVISRRSPSGRETRWTFAERDRNPLNRGNLLEVTELPHGDVTTDQASLVTTYEYAPRLQLLTARTDPRGNTTTHDYDEHGNLVTTTYPPVSIQPIGEGRAKAAPLDRTQQCRYAYNSSGQLLRRTHIDSTLTEYHYYPVDDPCGARGRGTAISAPDQPGGYLARVVCDADGLRVTNEYAYDQFGNRSALYDGKGNAARLVYNAMGRVESVVGRQPFGYRVDYRYDANYNQIEAAQSFQRPAYDEGARKTTLRSSTLRELRAYNELNNLTERRLVGDDIVIRESFVRDAGERVVRLVQPLGNVTGYVFDERDLIVAKEFAVGTREGFVERSTYTLDGVPRSRTDGDGNTTTHHYDGFNRYRGFTDPIGTAKHQSFDEAGNVIGVTVRSRDEKPLMEARYHFDQWNRPHRISQTWQDLDTGEPVGKSAWDGEKGIVATVVEYSDNGLPGKIWYESGNVVAVEYDGAGRFTAISDLSGQALSFEYDENGNGTLLRISGTEGGNRGSGFETVVSRSYDGMDRLEAQQSGDGAPERFRYNALGAVIGYVGKSGLEIHHTFDSLGRRTGHAFAVAGSKDGAAQQPVARAYEYDDNYRLSAYVDASGNRTIYKHDGLDRQTGVVYPDGGVVQLEYDSRGNAVRVVDQNGAERINRYDAADRLIERTSRRADTDMSSTELYEYDGAGRLLYARAGDELRRTYDSLSWLRTETQGDRVTRFEHDSAGNLTSLAYPGGEELHRTYDVRKRVTAVHRTTGARVASFSYGAGDKVVGMTLGDAIEATLVYDSHQRLESIEYKKTADHKLVARFRYGYDAADKMTHEIQSLGSEAFGERYYFDDANRPIRAQYGVQDVFDPNSTFEQQTSYEHFPEGPWKLRTDVDANGQIISEREGTIDQRNRYLQFGKFSFDYDRNGNCVRKTSSNPGFCLNTYDENNWLIKVECFDALGQLKQTIEYSYDALGRQIRKVVTDSNGVTTDYTYVWIGSLLVEEYENGVLVRSYVYGIGSTPVEFSSHKAGRADYTYIFNGRGLADGLLHKEDPNAFAEKYGYELTGDFYMTEIDGVRVGLPARDTTASGLLNSILSGDTFGSVLADWANGTLAGPGGGQMDPTIADALNSLGAIGSKGHHGVKSAMADQLNGMLNTLGLGGNASAPSIQGAGSGFLTNPKQSLYADGDDSTDGGTDGSTGGTSTGGTSTGGEPAGGTSTGGEPSGSEPAGGTSTGGSSTGGTSTGGEPTPPPLVSVNDDGTTTVHNGDGTSSTGTASDPSDWANPYAGKLKMDDKPGIASTPLGKAATAVIGVAKAYSDLPVNLGVTSGGGAGTGTPTFYGPAINIKLPPWKYVDPDAADSTQVSLPSPEQLEAKFNQLKHPVNPNGGPDTTPVDASSPPPQHDGPDPTIALIDPDASAGTGGGTPKINIAPIDHVPGWQPSSPEPNPAPGNSSGDAPNMGRRWP